MLNSVAANFGLASRRVAVNYYLAKILLMQEELISDPEQIPLELHLQRGARSRAGMGKKEVSTGERQGKASEKATMALRHSLSKRSCNLMLRLWVVVLRGC